MTLSLGRSRPELTGLVKQSDLIKADPEVTGCELPPLF